MPTKTRDEPGCQQSVHTSQSTGAFSCSIQVHGHLEKCPSKVFLTSVGHFKSFTTRVVDSVLFSLLSQVLIMNGEFSSHCRHANFNSTGQRKYDSLSYIKYFYLLKNQKREYIMNIWVTIIQKFKYLLSITICSQFISLGPCVHGFT